MVGGPGEDRPASLAEPAGKQREEEHREPPPVPRRQVTERKGCRLHEEARADRGVQEAPGFAEDPVPAALEVAAEEELFGNPDGQELPQEVDGGLGGQPEEQRLMEDRVREDGVGERVEGKQQDPEDGVKSEGGGAKVDLQAVVDERIAPTGQQRERQQQPNEREVEAQREIESERGGGGGLDPDPYEPAPACAKDRGMRIEPGLHVVTAPNPGIMTASGTNQYLLGESRVTLVDAALGIGPNLDLLLAELETMGASVESILLTHIHPDHLGGASELRTALGARLGMHRSRKGYAGVEADFVYQDGDEIPFAGGCLRVVHTPGHESGHCCFYEPSRGWLFTGDHVVGQGTVVIAPPDGDMGDYIASLRRLLELPSRLLLGGHGPVITDPHAKIQEYIDHRLMRELQVLDCLGGGVRRIPAMVERLYRDVPAVLHPVAERSVHAHLLKLVREGRAKSAGDESVLG